MMATKAEIQMSDVVAGLAACRDWVGSGSRPEKRSSLPNLSNVRGHLHCTAVSSHILCVEDFHQEPRVRHASAPARVVLQRTPLRAQTRRGSNRPHDLTRLGVPSPQPQQTTSVGIIRRRRSPPTLRIITGRDSTLCNDDSNQITSIAHLSSRSYVDQSGGTEMTDVVRATPSTSSVEPSTGLLWLRAPGQGLKALEKSRLLPSFSSRSAQKQEDTDCDPPQPISVKSHSSQPASVDRFNSSPTAMTVSKSPRNAKASRRQLFINLNENKRQSLLHYDDELFHDPVEPSGNGSKPSSPVSSKPSSPVSLRHPQFRTLRRKKHLDIVRCHSGQDVPTPAPIAISLTLDSPTAPKSLASIPKASTSHTHLRKQSDPESIDTASETTTCTTPSSPPLSSALSPPQTPPTYATSTSPITSSAAGSPSFTASAPSCTNSNVKCGHPNRPYYTAIRKQGISPPSSRPSSASGGTSSNHRSSPSSRPKSSPPPPLSAPALPNSAARHLSLSAMPPRHMGFVSAFSLDLQDSEGYDEDPLPLPPTPAPIPARFSFGQSLASAAKRLSSRKSCSNVSGRTSLPPPSTFSTHHHGHSHSISYSPIEVSGSGAGGSSPTGSGFRIGSPASGCGFSMSGETELKLALAKADTEQGARASEDGVLSHPYSAQGYLTTPTVSRPVSPPLPANTLSPPTFLPSSSRTRTDATSRKSFRSRVKKLRKGLKDMLLMHIRTDIETMNTAVAPTATTAT